MVPHIYLRGVSFIVISLYPLSIYHLLTVVSHVEDLLSKHQIYGHVDISLIVLAYSLVISFHW